MSRSPDQTKERSAGNEADEGGQRAKPVGRADSGEGSRRTVPEADARNKPGDGNQEKEEDNAGAQNRGKAAAFLKRPFVRLGLLLLVVAILAGIILWWLNARHYENTDDAFIDTNIVRLAPQTAGQIRRVFVNDNQLVQAGQLLVEIDSADAQSRLAQITAQRAAADTQLSEAQAKILVAQATYEQARSVTAGAAAQADNAARTLARYRQLQSLNPQAVAQEQVDGAEAAARNTAAQRDAAAKQAQSAGAQREEAAAEAAGAQAQIEALKAQVQQALINVGYTRITAPIAGHIAQKNAAPGNYVSPGTQLMAIVPLELWVTANFKETQLALMRVGQPVDIHVDACADAKISGHIDSIQRGAGQAFGLLPPENATGNYVKVVQRVPVKIVLDNVPKDCPLGPGMSVVPTVKVR